MKNLLTFILTIAALSLYAQKTIVSDSTVLVYKNNKFYEQRITEFDNGEISNNLTLIGDTTELVNKTASGVVSRMTSLRNDALIVSEFSSGIRYTIKSLQEMSNYLGGIDIMQVIRNNKKDEYDNLVNSSWTLEDGSSTSISFRMNAQGSLRYTLGANQARAWVFLGDVIRLVNVNGQNVDLYRVNDRKWINLDQTITLKKVNQ